MPGGGSHSLSGATTTPPDGHAPRSLLSTRVFVLWLIGLSILLIVLGALTGTDVRLVPVLVFLPAFLAGSGTVRQTTVAAVWVTVVVAASLACIGRGLAGDITLIVFTAVFGALSVVACRYRVKRDEEVTRLRSAAAALLRPLPTRTGRLVADATLFVCTDGVTGARAPDGRFYPLEDRLLSWSEVPPGELTGTIRDDLRAFTRSGPRDDIAWLALHRAPDAAAGLRAQAVSRAAARPATRPEKRQPPRKVPSSER